MKVKEESEKVGLRLHFQKTKIMASSPITSWQIDGETVETVTDFIFLGSKITIEKTLAPWKKSYYKPRQHIKAQRHYLANKGLYSQSYGFSSSHGKMWCERWTHKEGWVLKNWCFRELMLSFNWCWRRLLRVPWPARRSNQSVLKEINPNYSLEGLMLKLKLQYFGHLMWRTDSFERTLMLGKIEGRSRRGRQRMRWLNGITDWMDMSLSNIWEKRSLACCSPWGHKESDRTEQLNKLETS